MEAISPGFIVGFGMGFWAWVVLAIWTVSIITLVAWERPGSAALTVVITLAILQFVGGKDVLGYILDNPMTILKWGAYYVAVGVAYSFVRWDQVGREWRKNYESAEPGSGTQKYYWDNQPDAAQSKSRIVSWTMFWPWSMFWWLLSDVIKNAFEWLYSKLSGVYTAITRRHLAGVVPPPTPFQKGNAAQNLNARESYSSSDGG